MEVRRQITLCFIVCCCANIIYTTDPADGYKTSTMLPSEDSSNLTELETGYLRGKIMAHKNGDKLELRINSKVFWKGHKSMDSETCTGVVKEKGDKGDRGDDGKPSPKGEKVIKPRGHGDIGYKGDKGLQGIEGKTGEKGSDGIKGQDGDKGETGKCIVKPDKTKQADYGEYTNPAYSCNEFGHDEKRYLNSEKSFEVSCQSKRSCILDSQKTYFNEITINKEVRLSSYNLDLMNFYSFKISQLSYLMTTTEGFEIELRYSSDIKILKILGWNGIAIEITPNIISNGCKGGTKDEEMLTVLHLKCEPARYLPMDFYIVSETENVLIELKSLCFI